MSQDIQVNLNGQTATLERSISKTQTVRSDLGESNSLIKTMQNRITQNKMMCYIVLSIVTTAALIVVYYKI